tara:strand:+ start:352 stop:636 length:285 start_codon:yes stop_codon:yes gene_type:complete
MAFKMKGFSGFKSTVKEDAVNYAKNKAKSTAVVKGSTKAAKELGKKAFVRGAAKVALKGASRFIPVVGQAMMLRDLYRLGRYAGKKINERRKRS